MPQEARASRLLHRIRGTSRSRRREHVFICMFYPSAALNPTHPDRKVRYAARRARAVAASLAAAAESHRLARETLSEVDERGRTPRINSHRERTPQYDHGPLRVSSRPRSTTHAPLSLTCNPS
ncbi:unnamed protein product [Colias eurytheme]|nr:unnamed protein product [Colias eurytheme]